MRKVKPLAIKYQSLTALRPNSNNARTHSKRQIRQIADSIRTFGFNNPILVDRSGQIIAGHGRYMAARLLGIEEVPTIILEDLTPNEIRAPATTFWRWRPSGKRSSIVRRSVSIATEGGFFQDLTPCPSRASLSLPAPFWSEHWRTDVDDFGRKDRTIAHP